MPMNISIPKHVEVTENGIIFYSNHKPEDGIYSYVSGKQVKAERINTQHFKQPTKHRTIKKAIIAILLILISLLAESHICLNLPAATFAFLLLAYGNLYKLCEDFFHAHISKKHRKYQQFHAAKHMVLNSYKRLGGVPNLWETKKKDKYYSDCEMYTKICETFQGILLSICFCYYDSPLRFFRILWFYIIASIISQFITNVLKNLNILIHFEWLFLANPTDIDLQVFIDGLDMWLYLENEIEAKMKKSSS